MISIERCLSNILPLVLNRIVLAETHWLSSSLASPRMFRTISQILYSSDSGTKTRRTFTLFRNLYSLATCLGIFSIHLSTTSSNLFCNVLSICCSLPDLTLLSSVRKTISASFWTFPFSLNSGSVSIG